MLHEILRLLRVFNDMKANELAERLNISGSYLSEIEHGKKMPSLSLIRKYSDVFGIPASAILKFDENAQGKEGEVGFKSYIRNALIRFLERVELEGSTEDDSGSPVERDILKSDLTPSHS